MFLNQVLRFLIFSLHIFDRFSKKTLMQLDFFTKLKELKNSVNLAFCLNQAPNL